jgi:hypothetical protein
MEGRKLLLIGGVVALAYYIYTQQKKKELEAIANKNASLVSKIIVTSSQVEDAIKKEEIKPSKEQTNLPTNDVIKEEIVELPPIKQAPIKQLSTTTILDSEKTPTVITKTKVIGGIKPKVLFDFEQPIIREQFQNTRSTSPNLIRRSGASREEF